MFSISAFCSREDNHPVFDRGALPFEGVDSSNHGFGKTADHGELMVRLATDLDRHVLDLGLLLRDDNHPVFDRGALPLEGVDSTSHVSARPLSTAS